MADAVRALAEDPERRSRLGQVARRYALSHLGRDPILVRHVEQMHYAIARRARRRPRWQRLLATVLPSYTAHRRR
jgi:hypothetical protein